MFVEISCVIFIHECCNATKKVSHKITLPQTSKILTIYEHWFPGIKMIPQYAGNDQYYMQDIFVCHNLYTNQ